MSRVGVAVIGLGNALLPHARALADLSDRVDVRWLASRSGAVPSWAAQYGWRGSADIAACIADPRVGVVAILAPVSAHLDVARLAFAAGRHVLCEKPLELTALRAGQLIAAGEQAGCALGVVFQMRYRPASLRLKAAIAGGELGTVEAATLSVPWWRPQSYYEEPGRGTLARDGGGVLLTQAIHALDLFNDFVGIGRVLAAQVRRTALHRMENEDYAAALVELANGAPGTIMATTASVPGDPETIRIVGSRGTAVMEGANLRIGYVDGRSETVTAAAGTGAGADPMAFPHEFHRALWTGFLDAVAAGAPPPVGGAAALAVQQRIEEILAVAGWKVG